MVDLSEVTTPQLLAEICRRHDTVVIATQRDATPTQLGQFYHCAGNYMTGIALAGRLMALIDRQMLANERDDPEQ